MRPLRGRPAYLSELLILWSECFPAVFRTGYPGIGAGQGAKQPLWILQEGWGTRAGRRIGKRSRSAKTWITFQIRVGSNSKFYCWDQGFDPVFFTTGPLWPKQVGFFIKSKRLSKHDVVRPQSLLPVFVHVYNHNIYHWAQSLLYKSIVVKRTTGQSE